MEFISSVNYTEIYLFILASSINFASLANASGYNTLGRPSSLPLSRQNYQRSTSNPDLAGSTPTSPDAEVGNFLGKYK